MRIFMPIVTRYGFVYGTPSLIENPLPDNDRESIQFVKATNLLRMLQPEETPGEVVRTYVDSQNAGKEKKGLVLPQFVGIVQIPELGVNVPNLARVQSDLHQFAQTHAEISLLSCVGGSLTGAKFDRCFPYLIHVGYDPETGVTPEIVRTSFGNGLPARVLVSPIHRLPAFYQKNSQLLSSIYDYISELKSEGKSNQEVSRRIAPEIEAFDREARTYGSTIPESIGLHVFKRALALVSR